MKRKEIIKQLYELASKENDEAIDRHTRWFIAYGFKFVKIVRTTYDPTYKIFATYDAEYTEINHAIELKVILVDITTAHSFIERLHNAGTLKEFNAILKERGVR